jgi:hypothetical protein
MTGAARGMNALRAKARYELAPPLEPPRVSSRGLRWGFVLCGFDPMDFNVYTPPRDKPTQAPSAADLSKIGTENKSIESVFSVFGSYILPLMLGLLGTAIGAIRELQQKIRDAELAPGDAMMTLIGLPVGAVAGLVVGLFFRPDASLSVDAGPGGKLSLSATAVSFLAGYGSKSFFSFVDSVIKKVFTAEGTTTRT